jgi:hypothetical protein
MAAGPTQKSTQITNFDATPAVASSAGAGAPAHLMTADGFVTPAASDGAGTIYLMARVPSYAVVKELWIESEAQGAGKVYGSVYYADDARYVAGGSALAGTLVSGGGGFLFGDQNLASAVNPTNVTGVSGSYTIGKRAQPLWQAIGLSTDPGGMFDIALVVHTTDITTGTGKLSLAVKYVTP